MDRLGAMVIALQKKNYPFKIVFVGADRLPSADGPLKLQRNACIERLREIACDPKVAIISNTKNPQLYETELARVVFECVKQVERCIEQVADQQEQLGLTIQRYLHTIRNFKPQITDNIHIALLGFHSPGKYQIIGKLSVDAIVLNNSNSSFLLQFKLTQARPQLPIESWK